MISLAEFETINVKSLFFAICQVYYDQRVCLCNCLLAFLRNHKSKLHEIFCTYVNCGRASVLL